MRRLPSVTNLLVKRSDLLSKVSFYFATKTVGDDFDPIEKNYTYVNQNPQTVKMYVREIEAESLIWKQMGTKEAGAVELLCEERYKNWFMVANKIMVNDDEYEVYKEATGGRAIMQRRPFKMLRVILRKK
jgi:hypothetical protein